MMDKNHSGEVSWDEYQMFQYKIMKQKGYTIKQIKQKRSKALVEFLKMTDQQYTMNWSHIVKKCNKKN